MRFSWEFLGLQRVYWYEWYLTANACSFGLCKSTKTTRTHQVIGSLSSYRYDSLDFLMITLNPYSH